jgi:DNA mismatch repair ATPase MutS
MSKLLNKYNELKKNDSNKIYVFKIGIFYNILNEDARAVSKAIGLKLTDLGPDIIKCGFPIAKLEKYSHLLNEHNIAFEIINPSASSNQNTSYNDIIKKIENIDLNNTTCKEAFDLLYNIQQKLKNIQ